MEVHKGAAGIFAFQLTDPLFCFPAGGQLDMDRAGRWRTVFDPSVCTFTPESRHGDCKASGFVCLGTKRLPDLTFHRGHGRSSRRQLPTIYLR